MYPKGWKAGVYLLFAKLIDRREKSKRADAYRTVARR
jgi:hypothetical protein